MKRDWRYWSGAATPLEADGGFLMHSDSTCLTLNTFENSSQFRFQEIIKWQVWCIVVAAVSNFALQELYLNNEFGSRGKNKDLKVEWILVGLRGSKLRWCAMG